MQRRSLIVFVIVNILISLVVAFGVITYINPQSQGSPQQIVITVPIVITPTRGPTQTPFIVTATSERPSVAALPTGLLETPDLTRSPVPTLDPEIVGASASLQGTVTALPQNCIIHTVKEGDTPFGIAEEYGADGFAIMEVNGMTEAEAANMQIGDTLVVPLEGCPLTAADLATEEPEALLLSENADATVSVEAEGTDDPNATDEPENTPTPAPSPTMTLPPTAANASVTILQVIDPNDITSEGVEIQNTGQTVNLSGWTLTDADGNTYTFTEQLVFSNARITIYSRAGSDTAVVRYWGRDEAVWRPGDVATLRDRNGAVQSTFRVPTPQDLP